MQTDRLNSFVFHKPSGQPLSNQQNTDYVPSIFVYKKGSKSTGKSKLAWYKRYMTGDIEESLEQDKAENGPSNSQDSTNLDPLFKDVSINTDG